MSERAKKLPLWLFGLLVAGALAFGAQRAMATPVFMSCNGGTCTDQATCTANCDLLYGQGQYDSSWCIISVSCCNCFL